MKNLKSKVGEFAEIAKELPENLQSICFELLLRNHLASGDQPTRHLDERNEDRGGDDTSDQDLGGSQEDLAVTDLHVKTRRFVDNSGLSIDHLNNLFYKEGEQILPLYEDLKTTRMSEAQIRITLLRALQKALQTGNFEADVEEVRAEATDRKCYDQANFAANYRNNKDLFDFEKYERTTQTVRLSVAGRKALAEVVKELQ